MTKSPDGIHLDKISGTAATLYVALFAACRRLALSLRSSNPTWIKLPKTDNERLDPTVYAIAHQFAANVRGMSEALAAKQLIEDAAGDEFTAGTARSSSPTPQKWPFAHQASIRTDLAALLHADRLYGGHPVELRYLPHCSK